MGPQCPKIRGFNEALTKKAKTKEAMESKTNAA